MHLLPPPRHAKFSWVVGINNARAGHTSQLVRRHRTSVHHTNPASSCPTTTDTLSVSADPKFYHEFRLLESTSLPALEGENAGS